MKAEQHNTRKAADMMFGKPVGDLSWHPLNQDQAKTAARLSRAQKHRENYRPKDKTAFMSKGQWYTVRNTEVVPYHNQSK